MTVPPTLRDPSPILQVADVARSRAFYRDLLGFTVAYTFPDEGDPAYLSLELPGGSIGVAAAGGPVQSASVAIWVYCDDVDAVVAVLRDGGARVIAEPADQAWGERLASVADPDGYTVHIGQPAPGE